MFYVTSNKGKFEEACHILAPIPIERISIDLEEIQDTPQAIIAHKAKEAIKIVQAPLIVDDVSLCCKALGGLPGPYIKEFLHKLGEKGLAELVHKFDDHSATVSCYIAYIAPQSDPLIVEGTLEGSIVLPRGQLKHAPLSWNPIFQPKGSLKTFGEMDMNEHATCSMRFFALKQLKSVLQHV